MMMMMLKSVQWRRKSVEVGGQNLGGLGDGSPQTGSRGKAQVGVWGRSPHNLL